MNKIWKNNIYTWKPCFKICANEIYFASTSWSSDELDYNNELEKWSKQLSKIS